MDINSNERPVALTVVACVGQKLAAAAPAADLYVSDWFRKARSYVEAAGRPWLIYSAKFFAVDPAETIEPYDLTMRDLDRDYRRQRGENVAFAIRRKLEQLDAFAGGERPVVEVLAGKLYREYLVPALERRGIDVVVSMEGLGIGEQKRWLRVQAERLTAARAADGAQLEQDLDGDVALGRWLVRVKPDTYAGTTGRDMGPILELLEQDGNPVGASYYAGTLLADSPQQLQAAPWCVLTVEETAQLVELARQAKARTWKPSDCYSAEPDDVERRWRRFLEACRLADCSRLETMTEVAPMPTTDAIEAARFAVADYKRTAAELPDFDSDGEPSTVVFDLLREAGWDAEADADFSSWCLKATPLECVERAGLLFEQHLLATAGAR